MLSTHSTRTVEHFVTLFDQGFLPMGLALHRSLTEHAGDFHLWILCMDQEVEQSLKRLALPSVTLLPLAEVESERLLSVKGDRSRGEYCWTLTPFAPAAVLDRAPEVKRVTYLDSDLFFFADPRILLDELEQYGKPVLITEHAYAPEYDVTAASGRFCVQFMTFDRTPGSMEVLHSWQDQCIEWCYARYEPDRFGDQKYLDAWPARFPAAVHILKQTEKVLAPWNVAWFARRGPVAPVFYHFQGFRLLRERRVVCSVGYRLGAAARPLYRSYMRVFGEELDRIEQAGLRVVRMPRSRSLRQLQRDLRDTLMGRALWGRV